MTLFLLITDTAKIATHGILVSLITLWLTATILIIALIIGIISSITVVLADITNLIIPFLWRIPHTESIAGCNRYSYSYSSTPGPVAQNHPYATNAT